MYIRQQPLISFEDLMDLQPRTKLELIFSQIDLSELVSKVKSSSRRGPKGYNAAPVIRALFAQTIESIPTRAFKN